MLWLPCCAWGCLTWVFSSEREIQNVACADRAMVSGGVHADLLPTWLRVVGHGSVICDEGTSLCAGSSLRWTGWAAMVEYHEYHHDGAHAPQPAICRFCLLVGLCVCCNLCWNFCHVTWSLYRVAQTTRSHFYPTFVHPNSSHWRASAGGGEYKLLTDCRTVWFGLVWFGLRPLEADAR